MQTKIESLPHSRVRMTITVEAETINRFYNDAIKKVSTAIEVKGFRKGHAPQSLVIQKAGNGTILQEMLDLLVPDTYYKAIKEQKDLTPVAQPSIDVKELKGLDQGDLIPSAVTYVAEVDVMPEVEIGDYKKIKVKPKTAPENPPAGGEDKEIEGTTAELKKVYGDDWLTKMGFKDESEARKAMTENIKQQKIFQAKADTFDAIIEEVLKKAKVEVPETFTHNEIHRMERQIEMQAKAYGMTFDDWLKREKKTHEDIHKEWHDQAEKAAKVGLVLGRIAEAEEIDPSHNDATRLVLEKLLEYATGEKSAQADTKKK